MNDILDIALHLPQSLGKMKRFNRPFFEHYDSLSPHKQVNNVLIIAQNCFVQLMTLLVNKMLKMGIIDPAIVQAWVFCDDMKREFKRLVLLASNHLNIPI